MTEPLLYSFRRCPFAIRARMALLVSGTGFRIVEVKLSAKPPELIAASAKATVPVMVLSDGEIIDESLAIMRWALERNDPERWLDGDDPALIAANDTTFKHDLDRYKYADRHGTNAAEHRDSGSPGCGRWKRGWLRHNIFAAIGGRWRMPRCCRSCGSSPRRIAAGSMRCRCRGCAAGSIPAWSRTCSGW